MKAVWAFLFVVSVYYSAWAGENQNKAIAVPAEVMGLYAKLEQAKMMLPTATDTTWLFLRAKAAVGDTTLVVSLMAVNKWPLDIAAAQGVTHVSANSLQMTELQATKSDGTVKTDALAFMGNETQSADMRHRSLVIGSTSQVPKVKDTLSIAKMHFKILSPLNKGDKLKVDLDEVVLSTFNGGAIYCNTSLTLDIAVAEKDSSGGGEDTTEVDDRLRLRLLLQPANVDEGYLYQDIVKKAELDVALKFRVMVSSLQMTIQAPSSAWILAQPILSDGVGNCLINDLGGGKYKILYTRPADKPLIPGIDGATKVIMKLSFVLSDGKMPFGPQRIVVSGIGVASLFETGLKINTDTATTLNINKLFGKKFGRKGDLNYTAEWKCGDGVINKLDPDLVSGYIIGQIEFNDYQIWAADLTNNGKVEVDDLVELQKLVLVSEVEDELIARFSIALRERSLYINNPNAWAGELVISDLTGKLVLKTTDLSSREIQLAAGFYAYSAKAGKYYKNGILSIGQ